MLLQLPLNRRQRKFYCHRIDIYNKGPVTKDPTTGKAMLGTFPLESSPSHSMVQVLWKPTPDFEEIAGLGLMTQDNIFTQDFFHCGLYVAVGTGDIVVLRVCYDERGRSIDHPDLNHPWEVQGEPLDVPPIGRCRGNYKQVYMKQGTRPGNWS